MIQWWDKYLTPNKIFNKSGLNSQFKWKMTT